jgi:hypothetical protein
LHARDQPLLLVGLIYGIFWAESDETHHGSFGPTAGAGHEWSVGGPRQAIVFATVEHWNQRIVGRRRRVVWRVKLLVLLPFLDSTTAVNQRVSPVIMP